MDIDYGPLTGLIGSWRGDDGMDVSPEPDGEERNPFYETIVFEAAGDVENAERQRLAVVRYHQTVTRKADDQVFHDQVGYWLWDPAAKTVMQTLTIPRGLSLVAGGSFDPAGAAGGAVVLEVAAQDGGEWGIAQSPFLTSEARTVSFQHRLTVEGDRLSYFETTTLSIYGRTFEHTDESTLERTG